MPEGSKSFGQNQAIPENGNISGRAKKMLISEELILSSQIVVNRWHLREEFTVEG